MKSERYNILVVPRLSSKVRRLEFSRRFLLTMGAIAGCAVIAFVGAIAGLVHYREVSIETEHVRVAAAAFQKDRALLLDQMARVQETVGRTDRLAARLKSHVDADPADPAGIGPLGHVDVISGLGEARWRAPADIDLSAFTAKVAEWENQATLAESVLHQAFARHQDQLFLWSALPTIWPVRGWVTSAFGDRRGIHGSSRWHDGIDIAGPRGTPVVASGDGFITYAGYRQGYGLAVTIDHGYGVTTLYGHCSRLHVSEGMRVSRGDVIGTVGSTGFSTGPHLHYEVHVDGAAIDPLHYIIEHS